MISHEEALQVIRERVQVLGAEELEIARCAGRVLAADVVCRLASPPFNKAAMDGFAARAPDLRELPVELSLVGDSFAGGWPDFHVGPGQCARVTTGAPVPDGADTIVMVEHTRELGGGKVLIEKLSGSNICARGEDMAEGHVVLGAGQALTAMRLGVAASAGWDRLLVHRLPSVALLCTGTEVLEPGVAVDRGKIYNANGSMLGSLLAPLSSRFEYAGIVPDRQEDMEAAIRRALKGDLVAIVGGVSVGQRDLVPHVLERLGVEIVFHRVAIKPGMPVLFGRRGATCVFGLPGNPQSCFVVFHVLLRAALARMSGAKELPPALKSGRMARGFRNKPERKNFKPCRIEVRDGVNYIVPVQYHGSADITGPSSAHAYLVVPQGVERVEEGEIMDYFEV